MSAERWKPSASRLAEMKEDPAHPGKHIDPLTGIWPACEWGFSCQRGFVRNERFGDGQVIPGTNRAKTRATKYMPADGLRTYCGIVGYRACDFEAAEIDRHNARKVGSIEEDRKLLADISPKLIEGKTL